MGVINLKKNTMKRILAIAASIALVFSMTSCNNNQTSMEKKTTPNPENAAKAQQFIKDAGSTYFLATAETNGQAHVRPFGTAEIFEGKLYIQTGKVKNVYKQLAANPKAELCCYNAATGEWIRICGDLIPDERIEAKADMLAKNPSLQSMYKADDDNTIVLYFENATATISSFTSDPVTFEF